MTKATQTGEVNPVSCWFPFLQSWKSCSFITTTTRISVRQVLRDCRIKPFQLWLRMEIKVVTPAFHQHKLSNIFALWFPSEKEHNFPLSCI